MAWPYYVLLFAGVFACSTSVIWIKESELHPIVISALRLAIAAVLLAPVTWRDYKRHREAFDLAALRRTTLPAAVLAVHLIMWSYGARMTIAAQATLLVNLVPVAMPFFLAFTADERINRAEILGTTLAMVGVFVLGARDAIAPGGDSAGNVVCFGSMLLFAWYLALGRRNRDFPTIWLYVGPLYAQAAIFSLLLAAPWLGEPEMTHPREWMLMVLLAVVPTIAGHSFLNASMRRLRGQVVGLGNTTQFIFAGVMAFVMLGEVPPLLFYAASILVVAGVAVIVLRRER